MPGQLMLVLSRFNSASQKSHSSFAVSSLAASATTRKRARHAQSGVYAVALQNVNSKVIIYI